MKFIKIIAIYLVALGLIHFSVQKKMKSSQQLEASESTTEVSILITSNRSPASLRKPAPQAKIRSIRARTQNFALKAGSDFCPKDLIFTERKDCGGFEISDTNLNFKDQFCKIGQGLQKFSENKGQGFVVNHLITTQRDGKRYTKKQVSTAFHKKEKLQKSESEIHLIIQGKEIMLDYSVNGTGSSCLYAVAGRPQT